MNGASGGPTAVPSQQRTATSRPSRSPSTARRMASVRSVVGSWTVVWSGATVAMATPDERASALRARARAVAPAHRRARAREPTVRWDVSAKPARVSSDLSLAQARRIALAAQGFADPAPRGAVDRRLLRRVLGAHRAAADRQRQRGRARALHAALLAPGRRTIRPCSSARRTGATGCCSSTGATRRRCCRWRRSRCCAGAWRARAARSEPGAGSRRSCATQPDFLARLRGRDRGPRAAAGQRLRRCARQGLVVGLERREDAAWRRCSGAATSRPRTARASSASTTCPSACCRAAVLDAADAERGRRAARAGAHRGARAGRRGRARPARLLPARPGRRAGAGRRAARERRAAPGAGRGRCAASGYLWHAAKHAAPGARARAALAVRPGGLGARAHPRAVRVRLPDRDLHPGRTSACTATTCCRSCSATGSSRGSTSSTTAPPACCACSPPTSSRTPARADVMPELRDELHLMAEWLGATEVAVKADANDKASGDGPSTAYSFHHRSRRCEVGPGAPRA